MAAVRSIFWTPVLRKLTKSVIQNCYGCKRFRATHYPNPKPGFLTRDRTEQPLPSEIIGTDYVGPLYYKSKGKKDLKTYILSFFCSVSRTIHLELVPNLTTTEFIKSFKRLILRRPKSNIIYSDNSKTFKAGAKWLNSINRDEKFHDFFNKERIIKKFNLSRAPWWAGQYQFLTGFTKQSLYKSIGKSLLTWSELEEVLLDVEVSLNHQPLTYIEEDLEYSMLTTNSMIFWRRYQVQRRI